LHTTQFTSHAHYTLHIYAAFHHTPPTALYSLSFSLSFLCSVWTNITQLRLCCSPHTHNHYHTHTPTHSLTLSFSRTDTHTDTHSRSPRRPGERGDCIRVIRGRQIRGSLQQLPVVVCVCVCVKWVAHKPLNTHSLHYSCPNRVFLILLSNIHRLIKCSVVQSWALS
jgi:hypothetical protein